MIPYFSTNKQNLFQNRTGKKALIPGFTGSSVLFLDVSFVAGQKKKIAQITHACNVDDAGQMKYSVLVSLNKFSDYKTVDKYMIASLTRLFCPGPLYRRSNHFPLVLFNVKDPAPTRARL